MVSHHASPTRGVRDRALREHRRSSGSISASVLRARRAPGRSLLYLSRFLVFSSEVRAERRENAAGGTFHHPAQQEVCQVKGALPNRKSPFVVAGAERNETHFYLTMTSTRRFLARPSAVLLLAIGLLSPWPAADKLVLTPPSCSARAAL